MNSKRSTSRNLARIAWILALILGYLVIDRLDGEGLRAQEPKTDWEIASSEFLYESASFPSCHASTIAESHGQLVAAWFGGTHEKHPDVGIWVAHCIDGSWTPPREVANGIVPSNESGSNPTRFPTWNPVLFQPRPDASGAQSPLMLFYKVGPSPETWWGMVIESRDGGLSWSPPHRLPEGILGPIKNKPIELDNGTWLSPSSTESEEENSKWQVHFEWSKDHGASWHRTPSLNDGVEIQAIQPSLLKLADGKLLGLGRTRQNKVFETESQDQGRNWTPLRLGTLPNNNSGLDAITHSNGQHLIVYNHVPGTPGEWGGKRTPLNVAISDDAQQWRGLLVLENNPGEYSYPAIIESADGNVHVTYTWNRKKIKHAVIHRVTPS